MCRLWCFCVSLTTLTVSDFLGPQSKTRTDSFTEVCLRRQNLTTVRGNFAQVFCCRIEKADEQRWIFNLVFCEDYLFYFTQIYIKSIQNLHFLKPILRRNSFATDRKRFSNIVTDRIKAPCSPLQYDYHLDFAFYFLLFRSASSLQFTLMPPTLLCAMLRIPVSSLPRHILQFFQNVLIFNRHVQSQWETCGKKAYQRGDYHSLTKRNNGGGGEKSGGFTASPAS